MLMVFYNVGHVLEGMVKSNEVVLVLKIKEAFFINFGAVIVDYVFFKKRIYPHGVFITQFMHFINKTSIPRSSNLPVPLISI